MYHAWQQFPSGPFTDFFPLSGGSFSSPPILGRNLDGRLEVFCVGNDLAMWHAWQVDKNSYWSTMNSLGGGFKKLRPAIAPNIDGRLDIFNVGTDNAIWHANQVQANGHWNGWATLGGSFNIGPAVGRNADGRLRSSSSAPTGSSRTSGSRCGAATGRTTRRGVGASTTSPRC